MKQTAHISKSYRTFSCRIPWKHSALGLLDAPSLCECFLTQRCISCHLWYWKLRTSRWFGTSTKAQQKRTACQGFVELYRSCSDLRSVCSTVGRKSRRTEVDAHEVHGRRCRRSVATAWQLREWFGRFRLDERFCRFRSTLGRFCFPMIWSKQRKALLQSFSSLACALDFANGSGSNLHYATVLPSMKKYNKFLKQNQVLQGTRDLSSRFLHRVS